MVAFSKNGFGYNLKLLIDKSEIPVATVTVIVPSCDVMPSSAATRIVTVPESH